MFAPACSIGLLLCFLAAETSEDTEEAYPRMCTCSFCQVGYQSPQ